MRTKSDLFENSFSRKSKKYRAKHLDALTKLYGNGKGIEPLSETIKSQDVNPDPHGQIKNVI